MRKARSIADCDRTKRDVILFRSEVEDNKLRELFEASYGFVNSECRERHRPGGNVDREQIDAIVETIVAKNLFSPGQIAVAIEIDPSVEITR